MNKCSNITREEWTEIARVPDVIEGWGLDGLESSEDIGSMIWGAKFEHYVTDGPGYSGPLYILQGGDIVPPMVLYREKDALVRADFNW